MFLNTTINFSFFVFFLLVNPALADIKHTHLGKNSSAPQFREDQIHQLPPDLFSHPAQVINHDNLEQFLNTLSNEVINPESFTAITDKEIYLKRHIHDKIKYESDVTYIMPGMPASDTKVSFSKQEYIDSVINLQNVMQDYKSETFIGNKKISKNGKTATIRINIAESGIMTLPEQNNGQALDNINNDASLAAGMELAFSGNTSCDQEIGLSEQNYLQIQKTKCVTEIRFKRDDDDSLTDSILSRLR
jgi:hypothetical protein